LSPDLTHHLLLSLVACTLTGFNLYGKIPPDYSWVWASFHDSGFWNEKAKQLGVTAVEEVLSNLSQWTTLAAPSPTLPKIFLKKDFSVSAGLYSSLKTDHGVFFEISDSDVVATDNVLDKHSTFLNSLKSQLDILNVNLLGTKAKVIYQTMGLLHTTELCAQHEALDCHALPHLDDSYVGEMQRHVFAFCQANPLSRITYLRNRIPASLQTRDSITNEQLLPLTKAVTSQECVRKKDDLSCNVCGLHLYVQPAISIAGDMYTADCSYINQLLEPEWFVTKMSEFVAEALTLQIWGKLVSPLFKVSMETMGLDHFAPHHWIGSGPSISPCQVEGFGLERQSKTNDYSVLQKAPRNLSSALNAINATVAGVESLRMRELTYLPGLLLKWYMLYGNAPDFTSWVYDVYPDGELWRQGIAAQGQQFHEEMLLKYMDSGAVS
jgi:hypothetical protein